MVEGDASKMWRGPPLHREREAGPRRAAHGDAFPGQLQRARYTACRAQALGVSLSRSRQIRREPNDNKHLQLQTSALSLIEPYRVLAKVTNRRAPVQALMSRKGFLAQWQTLTISRAGSDRGRFRGGLSHSHGAGPYIGRQPGWYRCT